MHTKALIVSGTGNGIRSARFCPRVSRMLERVMPLLSRTRPLRKRARSVTCPRYGRISTGSSHPARSFNPNLIRSNRFSTAFAAATTERLSITAPPRFSNPAALPRQDNLLRPTKPLLATVFRGL
jgi:hypothetical protein